VRRGFDDVGRNRADQREHVRDVRHHLTDTPLVPFARLWRRVQREALIRFRRVLARLPYVRTQGHGSFRIPHRCGGSCPPNDARRHHGRRQVRASVHSRPAKIEAVDAVGIGPVEVEPALRRVEPPQLNWSHTLQRMKAIGGSSTPASPLWRFSSPGALPAVENSPRRRRLLPTGSSPTLLFGRKARPPR